MTPDEAMTWRQLKEQIESFTNDQLDAKVMWGGEAVGGFVIKIEVLAEDRRPYQPVWRGVGSA